MTPQTFGPYSIVRKLQGGGMGRVFLAEHVQFGRVALKLIDHGQDPDSLDILDAERRGAMLQEHLCAVDPRVTLLHDYGDHDGYFYIAMEYVEGRDLAELLTTGPLPLPQAFELAVNICEVLANAHTFRATIDGRQVTGVVHGDIKPRNLRVTDRGQLKVLDFGIAKAITITRGLTTNQFGSVPYSSPERLSQGEVNVASDLWSVGVVLYDMVAGHGPFRAENAALVEHRIRNYRQFAPPDRRLPEPVVNVLARALDPDPARRFPNALAFRDALLDVRQELLADGDEVTRRAFADDEATRRTIQSAANSDATRRPLPPPMPPSRQDDPTRRSAPGVLLHQSPGPVAAPRRPFAFRRWLGVSALVLLAVLGVLGYREWTVWQEAGALRHAIESERVSSLEQAWQDYQKLAARSFLPIGLYRTRWALTRRLTSDADRVIADYRENDNSSMVEADWVRARTGLQRALELDPGDEDIQGRLRLAEGHIDRINAAQLTARGKTKDATRLWTTARNKFEQARGLLSRWPDPHLGLASVYAYGFRDVDKVKEAVHEAERRKYRQGRREKAQLADSHRFRGEQLVREAQRVAGQEQEREYLRRALKHYDEAESLYNEVVPFAASGAALVRVQRNREQVDSRLEEIEVAF